jgi:hypothetical protein
MSVTVQTKRLLIITAWVLVACIAFGTGWMFQHYRCASSVGNHGCAQGVWR